MKLIPFLAIVLLFENAIFAAEPAFSSTSEVLQSIPPAAAGKKRKERDEEVEKTTNLFLANRALLLGKVQLLKRDLESLQLESDNKLLRRFVFSNVIPDIEKLNISDSENLFELLDGVTEKLNQIKNIKNLKALDVEKINEVNQKIVSIKGLFKKELDLTELKSDDQTELAKEELDLNNLEIFSQEPFINLIKEQQKKSLPYILARVKTDSGIKYYDAHNLNKYIFKKYPIYPKEGKWNVNGKNIEHKIQNDQGDWGMQNAKDILSRSPLISDEISYFSINSLQDPKFKFLTTFNNFISDLKTQKNFYYNYDFIYTEDKNLSTEETHEAIIWSPDGSKIATITLGKIQLWDLNTDKLSLSELDTENISILFSPDSKMLAISLNLDNKEQIYLLKIDPSPFTVINKLFSNSSGSIMFWTKDGNKIIGLSENPAKIKIWHINQENIEEILLPQVSHLALSKDSTKLAVGYALRIQVFNLNTLAFRESFFAKSFIKSITFSKDDSQILITSSDPLQIVNQPKENLEIYDYNTGKQIKKFEFNAHIPKIYYSPDATKFAYITGNLIKVWDIQKARIAGTLIGHTEQISSIAWSHDSKKIGSVADDNTIKIWNLN